MMRQLVMADIHGEFGAMQKVLEKAGYDPNKDQLILLGDYIDRGDESWQVVTEIKKLVNNGATALLGNHESIMIEALQSGENALWDVNGGRNTRNSYPSKEKLLDDMLFFQSLPFYYETDDFIFVHAGIMPGRPMEKQNKRDLLWARPEEFSHYKGKTLVCGHTPVQSIVQNEMFDTPFQQGDCIFIDTGMGWKKKLTLLQLPERVYWQSWRWDSSKGVQPPAKLERRS